MGHVAEVKYKRMKIGYRDEGFSRPQGQERAVVEKNGTRSGSTRRAAG
eukprot:COSAG02_NODE_9020_length_2358_cov_2.369190_2_plen_48_part_00